MRVITMFMALAVLVLLTGCAVQPEPRAGNGYKSCVPVMTYPAAGSEIELGLEFYDGAEPMVPQAYAVTERGLILLDTGKQQVVEFIDGNPARLLYLPYLVEGRAVAAGSDGDLYIFDCSPGSVIHVTWSGEILDEYSLIDEGFIFPPPLLKQNYRGVICLVSGYREYNLQTEQWADGLTFPGVRGKHSVTYISSSRAEVTIDGRARWTLEAGDLKGVRLIGYDEKKRLIATAVDLDLFPKRKKVLFTLYQDGTTDKNLIQIELDAYPENAISIGADNKLYLLGFSADQMVLYEIREF